MKSLLKNYVEKLSLQELKNFGIKNDINISDLEYKFILDLVKNNFEDILVNENKYFKILEEKIAYQEFIKIKDLFLYYKEKYKGYLF